jgi:WD40 repeat protein
MIISYVHSKKPSFGLLHLLLWLALIGLVFFMNTSCSDSDEDEYLYSKVPSTDTHFLEIETKDMGTISTVQDTLMAAGEDGNLYLWDWRDFSKGFRVIELDSKLLRLPRWDRYTPIRRNKVYALLTQKWIVHPSHDDVEMVLKDDLNLIVRDVEGQKEVNRWTVKGFFCKQLRTTRNGRFVAIFLDDDMDSYVEGVSRHGIDQRGTRLGVIGPEPKQMRWLPTFFRRDDSLPSPYAVAVSEDGNYVCIVGTCNGGWIMLADVVRKNVVWEKLPKGEDVPYGRWTVCFNDVCFSPDGKRIYVAGNCGLFCFNTTTGRIIKQWPTPRVLSVAVSPDERLVAIGEEGYHSVYICDVNSANPVGKPILELDTGQYSPYSLAFSPDSMLLATEGVSNTNIKIWKMPPPASETKTGTR